MVNDLRLHGVHVALVTPSTVQGAVDLDALDRRADDVIAASADLCTERFVTINGYGLAGEVAPGRTHAEGRNPTPDVRMPLSGAVEHALAMRPPALVA